MTHTTWLSPESVCTLRIDGGDSSDFEVLINRKSKSFVFVHQEPSYSLISFSIKSVIQNRSPQSLEFILRSGNQYIKLKERFILVPLKSQNRVEICENNLDIETVSPVWYCNDPNGIIEFAYNRKRPNSFQLKRLTEEKPKELNLKSKSKFIQSLSFYRLDQSIVLSIEDLESKEIRFRALLDDRKLRIIGSVQVGDWNRIGLITEAGSEKLFLYDFAPYFLGGEYIKVAPRLYSIESTNSEWVIQKRYSQKQFCINHPDLCGSDIKFHYFDSENKCLRFDVFKENQVEPIKIKECF
ncbi:MAG: hypothetical protein KA715_10605 [Xanthomonadaceae bacterium]|nr:hypothetical protein [Xanthomonadaceae bacterium]